METPIEGLLALVVLVARAGSNPQGGYNYQEPVVQGPRYSSQYVYQWDVNDKTSGNFYGQREQRRGENTQGSYYLNLPYGHYVSFKYAIDKTGSSSNLGYEGRPQRHTLPEHHRPPLWLSHSPSTNTISEEGTVFGHAPSDESLPSHSRSIGTPDGTPDRTPDVVTDKESDIDENDLNWNAESVAALPPEFSASAHALEDGVVPTGVRYPAEVTRVPPGIKLREFFTRNTGATHHLASSPVSSSHNSLNFPSTLFSSIHNSPNLSSTPFSSIHNSSRLPPTPFTPADQSPYEIDLHPSISLPITGDSLDEPYEPLPGSSPHILPHHFNHTLEFHQPHPLSPPQPHPQFHPPPRPVSFSRTGSHLAPPSPAEFALKGVINPEKILFRENLSDFQSLSGLPPRVPSVSKGLSEGNHLPPIPLSAPGEFGFKPSIFPFSHFYTKEGALQRSPLPKYDLALLAEDPSTSI